MIQKMLLTFEEAHVLNVLRENKKISLRKAAHFLNIHETTLHKYEKGINAVPIQVWDDMKVLYNSSLDGLGTLLKSNTTKGAPMKQQHKENIIPISDAQERARNMKAMRDSELDNKLQVHKILRSLSDVF